jgi:hypothetical protein
MMSECNEQKVDSALARSLLSAQNNSTIYTTVQETVSLSCAHCIQAQRRCYVRSSRANSAGFVQVECRGASGFATAPPKFT